jgi:predicted HAD superfamily Cof-like phosphohydrolase
MRETKDVALFHDRMGLHYEINPSVLTEAQVNRRVRLIEEEFDEFIEAWEDGDYIAQIDALMDLLYVTHGTLVEMGILDTQSFWNEVQRSNMTKVGGHQNEYGKFIKPATYSPADFRQVFINLYGERTLALVENDTDTGDKTI